jgi:hypothetical protein
MKNRKIIKNDTLFFNRDNQHGGILFDKVVHPLYKLFSNDSIKKIKSTTVKNTIIPATKSTKYDSTRKKKKQDGGFMTSLFFPTGYSSAASTLGLYTLNHATGKQTSKKKK